MKHPLIGICLALLFGAVLCARSADVTPRPPDSGVEPNYYKYLTSAPPSDMVSVIFKLYSPRSISKLDQQLHEQKASRADRFHTVMRALRANAAETQGPIINRLNAWKAEGTVEGFTPYWIENLIVVSCTIGDVLKLLDDPAIAGVEPNFKVELIDPVARGPLRTANPGHLDNETTEVGQNATGATRVNRELGITGHGVIVANCDTGVDGLHHALRDHFRGRAGGPPMAQCWHDVIGGHANAPEDLAGHGSHVMGTICGRAIDNGDTITVGAAPDAEWIACDAIAGGTGSTFDQGVLNAYQWFADPDGDSTTFDDMADVVQNSWGVNENFTGYTHCFSLWNTGVLNLEALGTVVTWSAGNEGPGPHTLRTPATFAFSPTQIFSVAAVDVTNHPAAPFPIADFSSRGPSICQPDSLAIKPEISAPGVDVRSVLNQSLTGYTLMSGTSMAGPHIAGVVALMREACPNCDPQTIKEAILNTAIDQGYPPAGDDNTFGMGFVDAYDAVIAVSNIGRVDGYVTLSNGNPLAGVSIHAVGANGSARSQTNGYYVLAAANGTYTVRYEKFGYNTVLQTNVQVTEGDTTHLSVVMSAAAQGILAGTVQVQTGVPMPNAELWVVNTPLDTMVTDAQGRFAVALPATNYQVHVRLGYTVGINPGTYGADTSITVNAGDTTHLTITVTIPALEPVGPDNYGYQAFDHQDRTLPANDDWVELVPPTGAGIPFAYHHQDSAAFLASPFPIVFYGQSYDTITVNCNGWMLPGVHHEPGHNNTRIPHSDPGNPHGIIAPHWDYFRDGLAAERYQWYDAENGRWIFQFDNEQLVAPSQFLFDWQVHIYDPAIHPTRTGDSEIDFVYRNAPYFSNCTVGIENPQETTGLQVLYNDTLNSHSWPIQPNGAIRFTTGSPTQFGTVNGTLTLNPPSGNITAAVITVGGRTTSPAANGSYTVTQVPVGSIGAKLTLDGYEPRLVRSVNVTPGGTVTANFDAWRLDPPRAVHGSQFNGVVSLVWSAPLSIEQYPANWIHYSVWRNDTLKAEDLTDTSYVDPVGDVGTVSYTVLAEYRNGYSNPSVPFVVTIDLAASDRDPSLPKEFALYQNYPNPFNPDTRIQLAVPENSNVEMKIYDLTGRLVRTLVSGKLAPGYHNFTWNSRDDANAAVSSGVYFCRVTTDKYTGTKKMLLVK